MNNCTSEMLVLSSTTLQKPKFLQHALKKNPTLRYTVEAVNFRGKDGLFWTCGREVVITDISGAALWSFEAKFDFKQAFLHTFESAKSDIWDDSDTEAVVVVGSTQIDLHVRSTKINVLSPFKINKVMSCPLGLIVERDADYKEPTLLTEPPNLYSVSNPYGELLPIISNSKESPRTWFYAFEPKDYTIEAVDSDFAVAMNAARNSCYVYKVREVENEAWENAILTESRRSSMATPLRFLHTPEGGLRSNDNTPILRSLHRFQPLFSRGTDSIHRNINRMQRCSFSSCADSSLIGDLSFQHDGNGLFDGQPGTSQFALPFMLMTGVSDTNSHNVDIADLDIKCSEVCLEHISTVAISDSPKSQKSNVVLSTIRSKDLCGTSYFGFIVAPSHELLLLQLTAINTVANVYRIDAQAVVNVKDGFMLVLDSTNKMTLYSGATPMCLVTLEKQCSFSTVKPILNDLLLFDISSSDYMKVADVPIICKYPLARELWDVVINTLPSAETLKFAEGFCRLIQSSKNELDELATLWRFLLSQFGFRTSEHPWLDANLEDAASNERLSSDIAFKVSRDDLTEDEIVELMRSLMSTKSPKEVKFSVQKLKTQETALVSIGNSPTESAVSIARYAKSILIGIHALYEEKILLEPASLQETECWKRFVEALFITASVLNLSNYIDLYIEDNPELQLLKFDVPPSSSAATNQVGVLSPAFASPDLAFCSADFIESLILKSALLSLRYVVTTRTAIHLLVLAIGLERITSIDDVKRFLGRTLGRVKNYLNSSNFEQLFDFNTCSKFKIIEQVLKAAGITEFVPNMYSSGYILLYRMYCEPQNVIEPGKKTVLHDDDFNALRHLLFPNDLRMQHVSEMLDSTRPTFIPPCSNNERPPLPDAEERDRQENFVQSIATRTMSLAFGHAALFMRTLVPRAKKFLRVPDINFSGRTYPENRPVEFNGYRGIREWSEFYNGVATGLRVRDSSEVTISGNWIELAILEVLKMQSSGNVSLVKMTPAAAGFLLGIGLNGHLMELNVFNIHQLLSQQDKYTSLALLLGCSASLIGTGDSRIHRILITHIPYLMGPTMFEVKVDPIVQTASILALGLLFAENGLETIIKELINMLGIPPPVDCEPSTDLRSQILTTGFAIGLIGLGRGNFLVPRIPLVENKPGIVERLLVLMEGGPRNRAVINAETAPDILGPFEDPAPSSGLSSHMYEAGGRVNPHITAAPAALALGLLFLRTNNKQVALLLELPGTLSGVDNIPPDSIFARIVSRSLVLWDEIEPSEQWIQSQIPAGVRMLFDTTLGIKNFHSLRPELQEREMKFYSSRHDLNTISVSFVYCLAAAVFSIALKYAGSHDKTLRNLIIKKIELLLPDQRCMPVLLRVTEHNSRGPMNVAINCMVNALGLIMAGSGDLEVLRIVRHLRRCQPVDYWQKNVNTHNLQTTASTTLGLLFLSNGRCSFKRDNMAIASLVIAFYPAVAQNCGDNRMYLQAFRFLWVLAARPNILYCLNANDDSKVIRTEINVMLKQPQNSSQLDQREQATDVLLTPALLPALEDIDFIEIGGGDFEKKVLKGEQLEYVLNQQSGRVFLHRLVRPLPDDSISKKPDHSSKLSSLVVGKADDMENAQPVLVEALPATFPNWAKDCEKWNEWIDEAAARHDHFSLRSIMKHIVQDAHRVRELTTVRRTVRMANAVFSRYSNECHPMAFPLKHVVNVLCDRKSYRECMNGRPASSDSEDDDDDDDDAEILLAAVRNAEQRRRRFVPAAGACFHWERRNSFQF